jgi:hypothetical protein
LLCAHALEQWGLREKLAMNGAGGGMTLVAFAACGDVAMKKGLL